MPFFQLKDDLNISLMSRDPTAGGLGRGPAVHQSSGPHMLRDANGLIIKSLT
jgi:hypothetical protein